MKRISISRTALVVLVCGLTGAQGDTGLSINPRLLDTQWKAMWITFPDAARREFGVFHFRKSFTLEAVPKKFVVHASADNRYQLFVNGRRVVEGPARGDLNHWRYETVDIATDLRAGRNVLAAVVWNYGSQSPLAQMTSETALIVQGDTDAEAAANTDGSWKCFKSAAIEMVPVGWEKVDGYYVAGPGERVNGEKYAWGWETTDYDDGAWSRSATINRGGPRGIRDSPSRWMLVPRTIPLMERKAERLRRVVRAEGVRAESGWLEGRAPLTVPANTRAALLLDQGYLTTAYPELVTTGGRGSEITFVYAEALVRVRGKEKEKGNRDETEGKQIRGYDDHFLPDGGKARVFRPLWWRTFRYVQVTVQTRAEPLVIEDLRAEFTAYPFTARASFDAGDKTLRNIWDVGWRTARLCAHETYMDCPYYEQLQYVGDTRIQALVSLYVTGDDRLVKNAIELADESRTPEGLTQSRYPSSLPQYIPTFSLLWIGMMHDLWWYRGEADFLKNYLQGSRGVLDWFEARLGADGLLGKLEWWNFVDWTEGFDYGVPPELPDGQSAIISLQLAAALNEAADLEASFGSAERAEHHRELARKIIKSVRERCWDAGRRLVADTPARKQFSQHANLLAVLLDLIPQSEQQAVMKTVLTDPSLTQCSYYFRFYLFRAMKKAGLADEYLNQLGPWRGMLALGLTTWAEKPEPTRSDCHAWSAHPNFDLLATVAGIEPAAQAFGEVAISPHLGELDRVTARLPHPHGEIAVEYKRQAGALVANVTLPEKLAGWFYWRGKRVRLHGGSQQLRF